MAHQVKPCPCCNGHDFDCGPCNGTGWVRREISAGREMSVTDWLWCGFLFLGAIVMLVVFGR